MNPSTDSLLYALVARGTDVLAEYIMPGISGNFSQVTRVLLSRIDLSQERATYELDGYLFHYFISKNITYLCMGDQAFGNFAPFEFLDDIRVRFSTTYGASASTAIAYSLNSEFSNVLQARMKFFNKARVNNSKIAAVQHELSLARNVMVENIDRVLERGDRIELLVDKSEQLDASALQFRKRATKLKRSMWCKNVKTISLMIVVVLAILYIILSLSCGGPSLSHCT
uniref:V-SNARE coiled-coil homology domain-containing protein n=1 Tax=Spongospora subterranea TaxID=70186 RepID=A0A0H5QNG9_9EUKA|eukprot:CRZ03543.1 hypothetical protein [Spongospora subterranea]